MKDLIAKLEKENDELEAALKGLSDMYAQAWDRVDGGLMMMDSGVKRFEKAHSVAYKLLEKRAALRSRDGGKE